MCRTVVGHILFFEKHHTKFYYRKARRHLQIVRKLQSDSTEEEQCTNIVELGKQIKVQMILSAG